MDVAGPLASRPDPAGAPGVTYFATDTRVAYYSDGAVWTAISPEHPTRLIAPTGITEATLSQALAANTAYFARFTTPRNLLVKTIHFVVAVAAGSNDSCDVGIYGAAGNRLRSSGATAGKLNVAAPQNVALSSPLGLVAGNTYYAAFSVGAIGGVAAQLRSMNVATHIFGSLIPNRYAGALGASHPLPAGPVAGLAGNVAPLLGVSE